MILISLRQTASEMERLEALNASITGAYKLAIRSIAQYAVELDAGDVAGFRERLEALAKAYQEVSDAARVRLIQSSFRGELRDYRDLTAARIARLREEVEMGAAAMAAFAGNIASHGEDHEARVKTELEHLRGISAWNDLGEIRRGIQGVIAGISAAVEQMQTANRMAVLQLQDELRMLHQDIESKRKALMTDCASGAWNPAKTEERIKELLREKEAFLLLFISIKNYRRVQGRFPQRLVDSALSALVKRLRGTTGDAPVGRRADHEFIVLLDIDHAAGLSLSREAAANLSSEYSVQDAGFSKSITLEVATGICERPAEMEAAAFSKKLEQLSTALGRG